jgi:hypothetical protein
VSGHLYLAAIATRNRVDVSYVSGLGLSWTLLESRCSGRDQTGVEVWMAWGIPSGNGEVTATFFEEPSNTVIAVSRYSGVDTADPVGTIISGNTNGLNGSCSGGLDSDAYSFNITTTSDGSTVYGAISMRNQNHTPGAGYNERAEVFQGDGGSIAGLAVQDQSIPTASTALLNGFFNREVDWAVIGVEIKPGGVEQSEPVVVNAKAFLEGPYDSGDMNTTLGDNGFLPLNQPFTISPWNYNGAESVSSLPADVVDWVLIALRTSPDASDEIARRVAFIKNDGSIVDTSGAGPVGFDSLAAGGYYIVIYHRNHVAMMSCYPQLLSESSSLYDFTTIQTQAYGHNPMVELEPGVYGMIAGDANADGMVNATDKDDVWRFENGTHWDYFKFGDFNLDGGIDVLDLNYYWRTNEGSATGVPGTTTTKAASRVLSRPVESKRKKNSEIQEKPATNSLRNETATNKSWGKR